MLYPWVYRIVLFGRVPQVTEIRNVFYYGDNDRDEMHLDEFQDFCVRVVGSVIQIVSETCTFYRATCDQSTNGDAFVPKFEGTLNAVGQQPQPTLPLMNCAVGIGRTQYRDRFCRKWFAPIALVHNIDGTLHDDLVQLVLNFGAVWLDGLRGMHGPYYPVTGKGPSDWERILSWSADKYFGQHRSRDPRYKP